MNYQKIYEALIEKARTRNCEGYTELHHIVPRCMGGGNKKENLVRLTAREHYIAHALLYKQHKTSKLAHAWFVMLRCDPNQKRFFTARQYENARLAHVEALKKSMKGSGNPFYGKNHSEETKKRLSEIHKGKDYRSKESIEKWVENVAKKKKSEEHRSKIGRKGMVMLKNIHTSECVRIKKNELEKYDSTIWKNPSVNQRKEKCVHCGTETVPGNIKRWHNENCKHKASR